MDTGEKIRQARLAKGLTQEELAQKLGYRSRSSVNKIETGGRDIPRSQLTKIAEILEVSPVALLGLDDTASARGGNASVLPSENIRIIPVYESVSAGFGAHADDTVTDHLPLYIVSKAEADNTMIIKVQGDSMYPKIEDGDSIQVLRQDFAESGQVAVLLIDGEDAVVKQFFHDSKAKRVTLHSFNPEYKDRVFEGIEMTRLRVLGIVKRVIKEI